VLQTGAVTDFTDFTDLKRMIAKDISTVFIRLSLFSFSFSPFLPQQVLVFVSLILGVTLYSFSSSSFLSSL